MKRFKFEMECFKAVLFHCKVEMEHCKVVRFHCKLEWKHNKFEMPCFKLERKPFKPVPRRFKPEEERRKVEIRRRKAGGWRRRLVSARDKRRSRFFQGEADVGGHFISNCSAENSPAIDGWEHRQPTIQSPVRDGRIFLSSLAGLVPLPHREPSHKWLGYFQQIIARALFQNGAASSFRAKQMRVDIFQSYSSIFPEIL